MPDEKDENAGVVYEPVNAAQPDWQCPHCNKRYGVDFDAACVCAAAGPADDVVEGVVVLDLTASTWSNTDPVFGVAVPGPVTAVRGEDRVVVSHRRDVTVSDRKIDSRRLAGVPAGDLVVIVDRPDRHFGEPVQSQAAPLTALGANKGSSLSWNTPGADGLRPIREVSSYRFPHGADRWFGPLGELRELTEMLVGFLDELAGSDPDAVASRWLESDPRLLRRSISGYKAALRLEMLDTVAAAHGAPDEACATRWLTDHAEAVAHWTAERVVEWAGGGDVIVPALTWSTAEKLPRSPGKKRTALMATVDTDDYRTALRAVTERITVDAPHCPVPDLGDVISEYTAAAAASRKGSR